MSTKPPASGGDGPPSPLSPVLSDLGAAIELREQWRESGYTVAFTNGCFDVLHVGHVRYLAAARATADRLIVALDDDASVRRLKGAGRPLVPLEERAEILAALRFVDLVVGFAGPGATDVLRALIPDVYVKGGDYNAHDRRPPEADAAEACGGRVVFVPYEEGHSTSALIARVRGG